MHRESLQPYLWMLCGSLSFALMGACAHALGSHCDWPLIALARATVPLILVTVMARVGGAKLVLWRPRTLWIRSFAGSTSLVGTFYCLTRLPTSEVFTLTNMFPLWVAVLSWPLLHEPPPGHVWLSVICGLAGVVLIQSPHLAAGNVELTTAAAIAFGCSLCGAVSMIGLHRLRAVDTRAIVVHFSAVAVVFSLMALLFSSNVPHSESLRETQTVALLCGVGFAATIGQLCLTKAFAGGPPAKIAVIGLTQIVFSMVFDAILFEQRFGPSTLLGTSLIVAPTAWLMLNRRSTPVDLTPAK